MVADVHRDMCFATLARRPRRPALGLQRQVMLAMAFVVALVSGALASFWITQQDEAYEELVLTGARTIGEGFVGELATQLEEMGSLDLGEVLDSLRDEPAIEDIQFVPAALSGPVDEALVLHLERGDQLGDRVADNITYSGDGTLVINQAIAYDGVTLGVVRVTLDNQQIHERQDAAKRQTIMVTVAVALLAALLGALLTRRMMRDLARLSSMVEQSGTQEIPRVLESIREGDPIPRLGEDLSSLRHSSLEVRRLSDAFELHHEAVTTLAAELAGRLDASDDRFRVAFEQSPIGMALVRRNGEIVRANRALGELLGRTPAQLVDVLLTDFTSSTSTDLVAAAIKGTNDTTRGMVQEAEYRAIDGTSLFVLQSVATLDDGEGGELRSVQIQDVSAAKRAEQTLQSLAFGDPLTGLANRMAFEQHLARTLTLGEPCAVVMLDLDRFKLVNDSLGHLTGDRLLQAVAARLRRSFPERVVARFGGDEFVMLLEGLDADAVEAESVRLLETIADPFVVGDRRFYTTCSVGVASSEPGLEQDDLIACADAATYAAKAAGRGRVHRFVPSMRTQADDRLQLEADLREAIGTDQIRVAYQPIVSTTSGRLASLEALARWDHPVRGPISPAEFIPIAEETGLIDDLGRQVLRMACRELAGHLNDPRLDDRWALSVNVSAAQLRRPEVAAQFAEDVRAAEVPTGRMILEVTESVLLDADAVHSLVALRAEGFRLAADDFGKGESSIGQLMRFPLDVLKIDMSLLRMSREAGEGSETTVMESVTMLGHALGAVVVAEGVETEADLVLAQNAGCDHAQGWLFDRPVPVLALDRMLRERALVADRGMIAPIVSGG